MLTSKDRRQVDTASLGSTAYAYDDLGRQTDVTEASGSSPDIASVTRTTYDALDRQKTLEVGYLDPDNHAQKTTTTYDLGGRAISVDDEFTCRSTTYDYRDLAQTVTEGQTTGVCTGSGSRVLTNTYDGLSRLTKTEVTAGTGMGDKPLEETFDSAGNRLTTSATRSAVTTTTTFTVNPLDQAWVEVRSDASTAKTNYDPAGSATDRCLWRTTPVDTCKPVGSTFTNAPNVHSTTSYDARNNRIGLKIPELGETTYDPTANYQPKAIYVPTASGSAYEHQTLFTYDGRNRLVGVTHQQCYQPTATHTCTSTVATGSNTYAYDDSDNRTQVVESGSGGPATTWNYCYDGLNRLRARQTTSACTVTSGDELYTYDDPGNRKTAPGNTFTYDNEGQLSGCTTGCGTVGHDATGRITSLNGWTFGYDAEGRMVAASSATGSATFTYDGDGHRTSIAVTPTGQGTTTTNFRYQGDAVVEESVGGTVTRSYLTDEAGRIAKMIIPAGQPNPGTYLVTWNGHGDALALWRVKLESDRTLEKANTIIYGTWGAPTTTSTYTNSATGSPYGDLGFRFLYVGASDVQWDNFGTLNLGLYYMHARHYSPVVGRFLQPDPSDAEGNTYAYAANSPATNSDASGLWTINGHGDLCVTCGNRGWLAMGPAADFGYFAGQSLEMLTWIVPVGKIRWVPTGIKAAGRALGFIGAGSAARPIVNTIRSRLLAAASNPRVRNAIDQLYRPNARYGSGSSMDAYRWERLTGKLLSPSGHKSKLLTYRANLTRILREERLSTEDKKIVKTLLMDIQEALSGNPRAR